MLTWHLAICGGWLGLRAKYPGSAQSQIEVASPLRHEPSGLREVGGAAGGRGPVGGGWVQEVQRAANTHSDRVWAAWCCNTCHPNSHVATPMHDISATGPAAHALSTHQPGAISQEGPSKPVPVQLHTFVPTQRPPFWQGGLHLSANGEPRVGTRVALEVSKRRMCMTVSRVAGLRAPLFRPAARYRLAHMPWTPLPLQPLALTGGADSAIAFKAGVADAREASGGADAGAVEPVAGVPAAVHLV